MNIEEERKAFGSFYKDYAKSAYDEPDLSFQDGSFKCTVAQISFDIWLAAKRHAVEMANPTCKIMQARNGEFWAYYCTDYEYRRGGFKTADEVSAWAIEQGYRVVE